MLDIEDYKADEKYLDECSKNELKKLVKIFHTSLNKTGSHLLETLIDKQYYRRELSDKTKDHQKKINFWQLHCKQLERRVNELEVELAVGKQCQKNTIN